MICKIHYYRKSNLRIDPHILNKAARTNGEFNKVWI